MPRLTEQNHVSFGTNRDMKLSCVFQTFSMCENVIHEILRCFVTISDSLFVCSLGMPLSGRVDSWGASS